MRHQPSGFALVFVLVLGGLLVSILLVASPSSLVFGLLAERESVQLERDRAENVQAQWRSLYLSDPDKAVKEAGVSQTEGSCLVVSTGFGSSMLLRSTLQPHRQLLLEDFPQDHPRHQWVFSHRGCGGAVLEQRLYLGDIGPRFGLATVTPHGNPSPAKLPSSVWNDYDISFNMAYYGMSGFGVAFHLDERGEGDCLLVQPRVASSGPQSGNIVGANLQLCQLRDKATALIRPAEGMQPLSGFPFTSDHVVRPQPGDATSYSVSWDLKFSIRGRKLTMQAKNDNGDYDPFGNPIELPQAGFGAVGFYCEPGTVIGVSNILVEKGGEPLLEECATWER